MDTCDEVEVTEAEQLALVIVGHVDHGKSTIIGKLLADSHSLPDGKLEQIKEKCQRAGKRFEYAFLLDALHDEQSQGITIEAARIFFRSALRHYLIIDAPGHVEFLKNMVTGASRADAAILVIDALEGIQENSRRHAQLLSLLGIEQVVVVVNKMDLVDFSETHFTALCGDFLKVLADLKIQPRCFIPVSGLNGDNVVQRSERMSWYKGDPILQTLDGLPPSPKGSETELRMFVQDVYKFTRYQDERRIVAGTLSSGTLREGDAVEFLPSGKQGRIRSIVTFPESQVSEVSAGQSVGFILHEEAYVPRGQLMIRSGAAVQPKVTTRAETRVFWLGIEPLQRGREYSIKFGTASILARVEAISRVVDAGTLEQLATVEQLSRNKVADVTFTFRSAVAFDEQHASLRTSMDSNRFVIVHNYRIAGGGVFLTAVDDGAGETRAQSVSRNARWIDSLVPLRERSERYSQTPCLLVVTGKTDAPRKELARALEAKLFQAGRYVYFTGIGNLVHGLDRDLTSGDYAENEHIRRLAEVAYLMVQTGVIFIVSAADITEEQASLVRNIMADTMVRFFWLGEKGEADVEMDCQLDASDSADAHLKQIVDYLIQQQIIEAQ